MEGLGWIDLLEQASCAVTVIGLPLAFWVFWSEQRKERAASYAKRFAAKEACSKALGTGLKMGIGWREMGVVNLPSGRPTLELTGKAALLLAAMAPEGMRVVAHLTITDDYPLAQAFVVLEALPL